jgi:peptidoglycan/LPS O-acetylase OafA/YrhL
VIDQAHKAGPRLEVQNVTDDHWGIDKIKATITYSVAAFVILAGMGAIFTMRNDPSSTDVIAIFAGLVGGATAFLYGQEVQTRTARQAASSTAASTAATTATIAAANSGVGPEVNGAP